MPSLLFPPGAMFIPGSSVLNLLVLTGAYKFQENRDAFFCAVIHCKVCVNLHKCTGLLNRKEHYPVPLIITHLNTSALRRVI
jgi:hypothetical protein